MTKKRLKKKKAREKRVRKYGNMHRNNKIGTGFQGLIGKVEGKLRT